MRDLKLLFAKRKMQMIKIRISYERPEELREVLGLLAPIVIRYKVKKGQEGQYNRAYIEADSGRKEEGKPWGFLAPIFVPHKANIRNVSKTNE